jgi:SAM-dependent methyltransferase
MNNQLNLCCGKDIMDYFLNVDIHSGDVQMDLNKYPWKLPSDYFVEVFIKMGIEHLDNPIRALKEIIRISRNGALLIIIVPHANSYASNIDLQHKSKFTEASFQDFLLEQYELTQLKLKNVEFLYVNNWKRYIPFKRFFNVFLNGIYDDIKFEFRIVK